MEEFAKLLERGGPSVVPLAATSLFANIWHDAKPEIPFYTIVVTAMGIMAIAAGMLFFAKWIANWPDTSRWTD